MLMIYVCLDCIDRLSAMAMTVLQVKRLQPVIDLGCRIKTAYCLFWDSVEWEFQNHERSKSYDSLEG